MNTVYLAEQMNREADQLQSKILDIDFYIEKCSEANQLEQVEELGKISTKLLDFQGQLYESARKLRSLGDK